MKVFTHCEKPHEGVLVTHMTVLRGRCVCVCVCGFTQNTRRCEKHCCTTAVIFTSVKHWAGSEAELISASSYDPCGIPLHAGCVLGRAAEEPYCLPSSLLCLAGARGQKCFCIAALSNSCQIPKKRKPRHLENASNVTLLSLLSLCETILTCNRGPRVDFTWAFVGFVGVCVKTKTAG